MEKVTQTHPESLLLRLGNWKYVVQRQNSWIGEGWGKDTRENPSTHSPLLQRQLEQLPQPPAGWTVWWGNEKTPEAKRRSPPHTAIRSDIFFLFLQTPPFLETSPACWGFEDPLFPSPCMEVVISSRHFTFLSCMSAQFKTKNNGILEHARDKSKERTQL